MLKVSKNFLPLLMVPMVTLFLSGCGFVDEKVTSIATVRPGSGGSGTILGTATLSFDNPAQWSNIAFNATADVTFTVTNSGTATATGMSFTGLTSTPYSNNGGTCGVSLAANATCTYIVRFTSPGAGTSNATLTLNYTNSGNPAQTTKALAGTGLADTTVTVAAVYPANGANWNDYVQNNGADVYHATGVACNSATTGGYSTCIHGGEMKKVTLTGLGSCTGVAATDDIGAFDWVCSVETGTATIFSSGLKWNKGLRDLIQAGPAWIANRVQVTISGVTAYQTALSTTWWSNPLATPPNNAGTAALILDGVDDDGGGPDLVYAAKTIFVAAVNTTTNGYRLNADKLSFVTLGTAKLIYGGAVANNSVYAERTVINSDSYNFQWLEVEIDGFNAGNSATRDLEITTAKYSVVKGTTIYNATTAYGSYLAIVNGKFQNCIFHDNGNHGLYGYGSDFVTLDHITAHHNGGIGIYIAWYLTLRGTNLTAYNNANEGIYLFSGNNYDSHNQYFSDLLTYNNGGKGISISISGTLRNVTSYGNGGAGVEAGAPNMIVSNVTSFNNGSYGIWLTSGSSLVNAVAYNNNDVGVKSSMKANTFVHILSANNFLGGVNDTGGGPSNNTYSTITVANNNTGTAGNLNTDDHSSVSQLLSINGDRGLSLGVTGSNQIANIVVTHNDYNLMIGGNNNVFSGVVKLGNFYTQSCWASGMAGRGITDACANDGASTATISSGVSLALQGPVSTTDASNGSNTNGIQAFASITDWINFANPFRTWGHLGAGGFTVGNMGRCTNGNNCQIWDYTLKTTDTVALNVNGTFTAGVACPASVNGNVVFTDNYNKEVAGDGIGNDDGICNGGETCATSRTYLINAYEIIDDGIGNDNGLCESNEACIYAPNIGYYQGSGNYLTNGTCTFQNGTVTGVTMYAYPNNGT